MAGRPQAVVKLVPTGGVVGAGAARSTAVSVAKRGGADPAVGAVFRGGARSGRRRRGRRRRDPRARLGLRPGGACGLGPQHALRSVVPRGHGPGRRQPRRGRDWAKALSGSGEYGDVWDHCTADHRDTEHPHVHVVVNRRGLGRGEWLKVSRRSEIDWDALREVQVEVARDHGIYLEASLRLARGLHERPVPTAEVRRSRPSRRRPRCRITHVTPHRLADELGARGTPVSHNAVWLWLRRNGQTPKKRPVHQGMGWRAGPG